MELDHKTKVSLFAVLGTLPFLIAGMLWVGSVATDAREAKQEVSSLRLLVLEIKEIVTRIDERQKRR